MLRWWSDTEEEGIVTCFSDAFTGYWAQENPYFTQGFNIKVHKRQ